MDKRGSICLRCSDESLIVSEIKNIFNKYTIQVEKNQIIIEKSKLSSKSNIYMKIYNHNIDSEKFFKIKSKTDKYISNFKKADKEIKNVLEIKHAKVLTYIKFKSEKKVSDNVIRKFFKLIRKFDGLLILNGNIFFDSDKSVLLDEVGEYEYKYVKEKLEMNDLESYRFYAEKRVVQSGFKIPNENGILKLSKAFKSEEKISKRIIALMINGFRAEKILEGFNYKDTNLLCRNIMNLFKVKKNWFTENELKFLANNSPTHEEIENSFKSYAAIWALLFSIGFIKEFVIPPPSGKYEDLLAILKNAISLEEIMSKSKVRNDMLLYVNMAYMTVWNSAQEIVSTLTAESIDPEVAEMWYKALLWVYYIDLEWDDIMDESCIIKN